MVISIGGANFSDPQVRPTSQIVQSTDAQMSSPHVVIIGGGFAGLSAAKALRGTSVRVTLVDRRNHHLFQPLLYQVATATLSPGDIASAIRWILRRAENVRVILGSADAIDPVARRVHLEDGATIDYDYLIVGTGSRHAYFNHPEWERYAPGLKTLEDALEIRRRILLAFERAERETDPRQAAGVAHIRARRRRSDRRRTGRHAGRDRATDTPRRVSVHRHRACPDRARRGGPDDPADLS